MNAELNVTDAKPSASVMDPLNKVFTAPDLTAENFDRTILHDDSRLRVVYFWGHDCPNCRIAKDEMRAIAGEMSALPADFYSVNAYEQMSLVNRFGLFGIPAFLLFKRGRLISKLTSFPTRAEFLAALRRSV